MSDCDVSAMEEYMAQPDEREHMGIMEVWVQPSGNVALYKATISSDASIQEMLKAGTTIKGGLMAWMVIQFQLFRTGISVNVDLFPARHEFVLTVL